MAAGDLQASPAPPTPVPITPPPSASSGDDPMKAGWQTASFVTWITLFLQLATVISHASTVVGGRYFAEMGWRLISDFAAASGMFFFFFYFFSSKESTPKKLFEAGEFGLQWTKCTRPSPYLLGAKLAGLLAQQVSAASNYPPAWPFPHK